MWKLSNAFLNCLWAKEEIKKQLGNIFKWIKTNKHINWWEAAKEVSRGKFKDLNIYINRRNIWN